MVAGLQGKEWLDFLKKGSKKTNFDAVSPLLLELPYQKNREDVELSLLFATIKRWIKDKRLFR